LNLRPFGPESRYMRPSLSGWVRYFCQRNRTILDRLGQLEVAFRVARAIIRLSARSTRVVCSLWQSYLKGAWLSGIDRKRLVLSGFRSAMVSWTIPVRTGLLYQTLNPYPLATLLNCKCHLHRHIRQRRSAAAHPCGQLRFCWRIKQTAFLISWGGNSSDRRAEFARTR